MNQQAIKIKATIMWPYLSTAQTDGPYADGKYKVNLTQLSEKATEALVGLGLKVREKGDQGYLITPKSINPIRVYDQNGEEIDGDTVGNGSECIAVVSAYENKYGTFPQLNKIVITKLEKYEPQALAIEVDDDDEVL